MHSLSFANRNFCRTFALPKSRIMNNSLYISPEINVIETVFEGVLCLSGYVPDSNDSELS